MEEGIMLTSLDAEGIKKDQLHVENMDGVSPYFNTPPGLMHSLIL